MLSHPFRWDGFFHFCVSLKCMTICETIRISQQRVNIYLAFFPMRKLKTTELGRLTKDEIKKKGRLPIVIVLDNVRSAYNVGSIFRTCDAFLVSEIILCGITSQPPNRELMKTALGSTASVPWKYFQDTEKAVKELKELGYQIILIEQTDESISLNKFIPEEKEKYALIFGNEVDGVSGSILPLAHGAIEIPQFGTKHSFNVSVSTGVVLWHWYEKLSKG